MKGKIGKQRGLSITGWIFYIAVGLFFLLLGFTLIPSYLRFYSVSNVMDTMATEGLGRSSTKSIRTAFARHLNVNSVYKFDYDTLKIVKNKKGRTRLELEYEDRKPMVANIDVVLSYSKAVDL